MKYRVQVEWQMIDIISYYLRGAVNYFSKQNILILFRPVFGANALNGSI